MLKRLIPIVILAATSSCGRSSDDKASSPIKAPTIAGSSHAGLVFSANNVDSSVTLSNARVYYYDFTSSEVRELSSTEAQAPALFNVDDRVFLFNRTESVHNVRVFDPKGLTTLPDAKDLPGLSANDPWDLVSLVPGKSALLASPAAKKLQVLDYENGELNDIDTDGLAGGAIRPVGLLRSGSTIFATHTGVDSQSQNDGTQQIYALTAATDGTLAFTDTKGLPLQMMTSPSPFLNETADSALIVGLCSANVTNCTQGVATFAPSGSTSGSVASRPLPPDAASLHLVNQIIDGPDQSTVFAHVEGGGEHKIVKIDLTAQTVKTIHTFSDERLYGISYDVGSHTLFVGDQSGLKGKLVLYHDDTAAGSIELDGVPFSAAFASK